MEDVSSFISTFDVFDSPEFHQWELLPDEIKLEILKYIPFPTLKNFMFLSRSSLKLARRIRPMAEICLTERTRQEMSHYVDVTTCTRGVEFVIGWFRPGVKERPRDLPVQKLLFIEDERGNCFVRRIHKRKTQGYIFIPGVQYECTAIAAALKALFGLAEFLEILDTSLHVHSVMEVVDEAVAAVSAPILIARNGFTMSTHNEPSATKHFLRFIKPGCNIHLYSSLSPSEPYSDPEFWNSNVVRAASQIVTDFAVGVTDEQIIQLRADNIVMKTPYVTSEGILQMVKEWIAGTRKIDCIDLEGLLSLDIRAVLRQIDKSTILSWRELDSISPVSGFYSQFTDNSKHVGLKGANGYLILQADSGRCILDFMS